MIGSLFVSFVAMFVVTTAVFFVANNKLKEHAAEHTSANYTMDLQHNRLNLQYDSLVGNINQNNRKLASYITGNNSQINENKKRMKEQKQSTMKKLQELDNKNVKRIKDLKNSTESTLKSYADMNRNMANDVKSAKEKIEGELKKTKSAIDSQVKNKVSALESDLSSKAEEIASKSTQNIDTIRSELNRFDESQRQISNSASEMQRRINSLGDAINTDVTENKTKLTIIRSNVDGISRGVDAISASMQSMERNMNSGIEDMNARYTDLISKQSQFVSRDQIQGLATRDQVNNIKEDVRALTESNRMSQTELNDIKTKAMMSEAFIKQNKEQLDSLTGLEKNISGMVDRKLDSMQSRFEDLESVDSTHNDKLKRLIDDVEQMKSKGDKAIDGGAGNKPGTDDMNITRFDEEARASLNHFFHKSDFVDAYLNRGGNTSLFRDWFDDYYNIDKMTKNFTSFESMIQTTDENASKLPGLESSVKESESKLEEVHKKIEALEDVKKDLERKMDQLENTGNYQSKIDKLDSELETLRTMMTMMNNNKGVGGVSGDGGLKLSEIIAALNLQQNSKLPSPAPVGNVDVSGNVRSIMNTEFPNYLKNNSSEIKRIVENDDMSFGDVEVDDLDVNKDLNVRGALKVNGVDLTQKLNGMPTSPIGGGITAGVSREDVRAMINSNRYIENIRKGSDSAGNVVFEFMDNDNRVVETVRIPSSSGSAAGSGGDGDIRIEFNDFRQSYDFYRGSQKLQSIELPRMEKTGSGMGKDSFAFATGSKSFNMQVPTTYVKDIAYDTSKERYVATRVNNNTESQIEISGGSGGEGGVSDVSTVDGRVVAQKINEQDGFNDGIRLGNICLRSNNRNPPKLMMCSENCKDNCTDIWDYRTAPYPKS